MQPPSHVAVEARDLRHDYGAQRALDGLSFSVRRGTVFGLLGANGAGKSTTVDVLATLLRPTSGRAFIRGADVQADPIGAKRRAAFVFENATPPRPHWTVEEYLSFFSRLRGVPPPDAALLDTLGLSSLRRKPTGQLSGGQRRRVEICRALAAQAEVLVLDEPTKELDLQARRAVWDLLGRAVRAGGLTILLCSHDVMEIRELCDEVLVIRQGRSARHLARGEFKDADPSMLERSLLEAMA